MAVVLAIEDDPAILDLITEYLIGEGYTVRRGYGDAALQSAQDSPPDLILLDMLMPGDTGIYQTAGENILNTIRHDPALQHIPVIVVTAWSEKAAHAVEMGADIALGKPFDLAYLGKVVKAAIGATPFPTDVTKARKRMATALDVADTAVIGVRAAAANLETAISAEGAPHEEKE